VAGPRAAGRTGAPQPTDRGDVRREQREAARREMVIKKLNEIFAPGVDVEEALAKLAAAFAAKGWKFETKDLTPELREFADAYLRAVPFMPKYFTEKDGWLLKTYHWRNQDHARVAAINHFVKRSKAAEPRSTAADRLLEPDDTAHPLDHWRVSLRRSLDQS
jgi:hypothetical protein